MNNKDVHKSEPPSEGWREKLVLSIAEAAVVLTVSERTVRNGIKNKTIPFYKIQGRVLIPVNSLIQTLNRATSDPELPGEGQTGEAA